MPSSIEQSKLSADENETIFRRDIVPQAFAHISERTPRPSRPTAVVLGGQPGAGKTATQQASQDELEKQGATIVIVGDDLRPFHPQHSALVKADPVTASHHTNHDAGQWFAKLIREGAARGVNMVIETTMRQPDNAAFVMTELKRAGYQVEARVLAVNERVSWVGVNTRFEAMLEAGQGGRIPPREVHDAAASGLVQTIGRIEKDRLADRVVVERRDGSIVYENRLRQGDWQWPARAAEAIVEERQRVPTQEQVQQHGAAWSRVIASMEARQADSQTIASARSQASADVEHFTNQREKGPRDAPPDRPRGQRP